jgi:PKD repeat protein
MKKITYNPLYFLRSSPVSLLALFFIFLCNSFHASADTYLSADLVSGKKGDLVQIPIFFETNETIVGADILINFDPNDLELGDILAGNSISNHEIYDDQSVSGELKITILSMTNDSLSDGNLSSLSFLLLRDYDQPTTAITVDLSQSLLISKSSTPFETKPILPITDLTLSFPQESSADTFAINREIQFSLDSDGSLENYSWSIGDQENSLDGNTSFAYTFNQPGVYLITINASNQYGNLRKTFEINIQDHLWHSDSADLGNGWRSFDWFGYFYSVPNSNWIYHEHLGWLYLSGNTVDSTWIWSEIWGWGWTNFSVYPYLALSSGDWLYYLKGSSSPIRFYDYGLKSWAQFDFANLFTVKVSNNNGGTAIGPSNFYLGDNVAFVARPNPGFVFAGWEGDIKSGVNPLLIEKPTSNISLSAKFVSISELINDGVSAINLSHLNNEEKQKAVSQLLLLGYSEYVDSGDASVFDLFSDNSSSFGSQVFNSSFTNESSSIKHSHFDINKQSDKIEFLVDNSRRIGSVYFSGKEQIGSVNCAVLEINASKEHFEKRWLAQDSKGNVWLIQSEVNNKKTQTLPTVILPYKISSNWKSWSSGFGIPSDFSLLTDYPFSIRPFTFKVAQNCLAISLNRTHFEEQKEVYSPDKGLVKISK